MSSSTIAHPTSTSTSSADLTYSSSPTKESFHPLNGLIYRIPHTTRFITSSVENVCWIVKLWTISQSDQSTPSRTEKTSTNHQSTAETALKSQAQGNIPEIEIVAAEIRSNEEYDESTKLEFAEAFKEMERMIQDQGRQEPGRSNVIGGNVEVEVLVFKKVVYDPLDLDIITPPVASIMRAWTFGRIELDFIDGQFQVIIQTDEGDFTLHQDVLEGSESTTQESKKDELMFWFIKFLENVKNHPVCSMPVINPTKELQFDINPIIYTSKNAIQAEKRKSGELKRKYEEMMNREITLHVFTEEQQEAQKKMEERWRKINEWMNRHQMERKEKAQKRLQLARNDLWDRLELDKQKGKKRQKVNPPQSGCEVDRVKELGIFSMDHTVLPRSEDVDISR